MVNTPNQLSKKLMASPYAIHVMGAERDGAQAYNFGSGASANSVGGKSSSGKSDKSGFVEGKKGGKIPKNCTAVMGYQPDAPSKRSVKMAKKANKQARREKDYFFVMRKGVCFFIFLFCLVIVAIMGVNIFTSMFASTVFPTDDSVDEETAIANAEILETLNKFTAFYVSPDNTPQDVRDEYESEVDEEGYYKVFDDTSTYYTFTDPLFGSMKSLGILSGETSEEVEEAEAATEDTATTEATTDATTDATEEVAEDTSIKMESPLYDETLEYLRNVENEDDAMLLPATIIFEYSPIVVYVVIFITAFAAMITSFLGMFGKRIFKGFGAAAIIILVMVAVIAFNGLVVLGAKNEAPYYNEDDAELHSIVNADYLGDYLLRSVNGAPTTEYDPEVDVAPVQFCLGYGTLIITVASAAVLVFSIFARRKLPYSIFDK